MTPQTIYAEVAVTLPLPNTFSYIVPSSFSPIISTGKRVLVPFGRRRVTGYVLGLNTECSRQDLKQILDILDESSMFPESMIPFFYWISDYYKHPIGDVIQTALPSGLTISDVCRLHLTKEGEDATKKETLSPIEREILSCLKKTPCRQNQLSRHLRQQIPETLVRSLCRKNWIQKKHSVKKASIKHRYERYISVLDSENSVSTRAYTQQQVMKLLRKTGEMSLNELKKKIPTAGNVINPLCKSGHIRIIKKPLYRDPFGDTIAPDTPLPLTEEQETVVNQVRQSLRKGYATYLLTGVTGSGKTEVYLQLTKQVVEMGQTALILVPEIALISQVERRFRARFGERIAVLHSGLSNGERYDQWKRILEKKAPIVIGARSAIFAPLEDIGLIVVDEEHETSYKQDHGLMYQARDLAVKRASLCQCVALLGSATPSIQSYYNAKTNKYTEVTLTKRVMERPLSEVKVVDLRHIKDMQGIRRFISPQLHAAMKNALEKKQQVLLFLNRRGFSNISICGTCGETLKCKNCDIALTLHNRVNAYKCHYCGFSRASVINCPVCGSSHIRHLGIGTEKVEEAVKKLFPEARVARMDRDTTGRRGAVTKILKDLHNNSIDVLVGTQMVAKGHDFPNITLVGIICADLSLNFPDFRSGVRTFQLLAQVAGRAGRGNTPGKVILQTYNPSHFSIEAATEQNFRTFYEKDILYRNTLKYPPFSRLIQLRIRGKHHGQTKDHAFKISCILKEMIQKKPCGAAIAVLGPIESAVSRIANQYRWQILIKGSSVKPLHAFLERFFSTNIQLFHHGRSPSRWMWTLIL